MNKLPDNAIFLGPNLNNPFAAILNSRQSKQPLGQDKWVKNTIAAVKTAIQAKQTILSSIGINTYEFVLWATGQFRGQQIVVCPLLKGDEPQNTAQYIIKDFNLNEKITAFLFIPSATPQNRPKKSYLARDNTIIAIADYIYPVSIRNGGNMQRLIQEQLPKKIVWDFKTAYIQHKKRVPLNLNSNAIAERFPDALWDYITHWTHSFNGRWHREKSADYYNAIIQTTDEYARSALHSLNNILNEHKIYATSQHIKGGFSVVSLTALPPSQAVKLMRWRRRWLRYTFEPYGIAIERKYALAMGIRPVIYGYEKLYSQLSEKEHPYFQGRGTKTDWLHEQEWRHLGDIDINDIPTDKIMAIVWHKSDVKSIANSTNIKIIHLDASK